MTNDEVVASSMDAGTPTDALSAQGQPHDTDGAQGPQSAAGERQDRRDERTRARLREAEQERDLYRDAVVPYIKAKVEGQVSDRLTEPAALWLLPELDPLSLLDDEMGLDAEKIDQAVTHLRELLPSMTRRFTGSADGGARKTVEGEGPSWASVIQP